MNLIIFLALYLGGLGILWLKMFYHVILILKKNYFLQVFRSFIPIFFLEYYWSRLNEYIKQADNFSLLIYF